MSSRRHGGDPEPHTLIFNISHEFPEVWRGVGGEGAALFSRFGTRFKSTSACPVARPPEPEVRNSDWQDL